MAAILDRLDGVRRTRRGWSARCPAHPDRRPSLSIAEGADGRPLLYCFARCTFDEILAALGIEAAPIVPRPEPTVFEIGMAMARRQPWYSDDARRRRELADAIKRCHRLGGEFVRIAAAWDADPDLYWNAVPR